MAAMLVNSPLAVPAAIITVKHGTHRIHAKTIHMETLQPTHGAGNQKIAYFTAAVIKNQGAPSLVLADARVFVLVEAGTVEFRQGEAVLWKVRWYPVQNDADVVLVERVHQIFKVHGISVAKSWGEKARCLISPGFFEGEFANWQQLYVGKSHGKTIVGQLMGAFTVGKWPMIFFSDAPPRSQVYLINAYGLPVGFPLGAFFHPRTVVPVVVFFDAIPGGVVGGTFEGNGKWVAA